ncbi:MAG: hypothetical protein D6732_11630 [Methanobacteriota archaeon]|nr:MAG: hypothetical protein D6732_11630 [Euryarchaeota archaeon]
METVDLTIEGNIAKLTITREKALNAINSQVLKELGQAIDKIEENRDIRIVIITGSGEKSFVAGADISEMVKLSPMEAREFLTQGQRVLDRIENLKAITVARINGYALGGGLELALACDIRIASDNALIGLPEVSLGLIPSFGGTQRLTRVVGSGNAKYLILLGKRLSAQEALEYGIVNEVVAKEELDKAVDNIVSTLSRMAPIALTAAKHAIYMASQTDLYSGQELEVNYASMCFSTDDLREGMNAFLEKRKPDFQAK